MAAAAASAAMLAIAHGFQTFGHYPPCELCLHQREGYWAAFWVAVVSIALAARGRAWPERAAMLLGLIFLAEAALASYHAGVEWKWWPGPASCTGGSEHVSAAAIQALMSGQVVHMVRCDQAAWRLFGLSMAGWNALIALALSIASFVAATIRRPA